MENLKCLSVAYYNKSVENINEGNINEAIEWLNKAYKINSNDVDTNNLLGLCYFKSCYFNEAIYLWQKSENIESQNNKANEYLAFIKNPKILEDMNLYKKALQDIKNNKYDIALEKLLSISKAKYGWFEVDKLIALIYFKKENYEKAYEFINSALKENWSDKKSNEYYRIMFSKFRNSTVIKRNNKSFKANENKKSKIIVASTVIVAFIALGILLYILSLSNSEKAVIAQKNEKIAIELEQNIGMLESKDEEINRLLQSLSDFQEKLNNLLNIGISEGEDKTSINELKYLEIALNDYKKEKYLDAIDNLNLIIDHSKDNNIINEATFWLAKSYENLDNVDMAISGYKDYIKNFKDYNYYDDAVYTLAVMLYKLDNTEEAKLYGEILNLECNESIYNNSIISEILGN